MNYDLFGQEVSEFSTKEKHIQKYIEFVKENKRIPTAADLLGVGVTKKMVDHHFGSMTHINIYIAKHHSDILEDYLTLGATVFSKKNLENLDEASRSFKRFLITAAVTGKDVDINFLNSMRSYENLRNAKILLMPCVDNVSNQKSKANASHSFDPAFKGMTWVSEEIKMNNSFYLSNVSISAKAILPLTGLKRFANRFGTMIYASPKQFLDFVPNANFKFPKAIMTTGAVTRSQYDTHRENGSRTSYIADFDHQVGAIVLEIVDDTFYHFRQIRSNERGEFVDLGVRYYPDGTTTKETVHFYAGDWHSGDTDMEVSYSALQMCKVLEVQDFITSDFFTGHSISHHDKGKPAVRAMKAQDGRNNLKNELLKNTEDMKWILQYIQGDLILIKGNHDEVLERYLIEARYVDDPENHPLAVKLADQHFEGIDPLAWAWQTYGKFTSEEQSRIVSLLRDDSIKIGDVEVGQHGDKGNNGARASLAGLELAYDKAVVGHSHTAAIFREIYRVGTFTKLKLDYNVGPSSWTHTGCLVYKDGSRQLINFIEGQWHLEDEVVSTEHGYS